jgi:hypothetical protein
VGLEYKEQQSADPEPKKNNYYTTLH